VADVGEEKTFVDGDVGGVLVKGGVDGALIGVPLSSYVRLATLLLVVVLLLLHLCFPFLVAVRVTFTCIWTFSTIVAGLTTSVANPLGAVFVFFSFPLFEDLLEDLNDKSHLLVVKLGGINWEPCGWHGLPFFSSVALNATGCTSSVEVAPCSKLIMCLESLTISLKLTNLPITSSGDIFLYIGFSRINCI
jgi:hypothetical protein